MPGELKLAVRCSAELAPKPAWTHGCKPIKGDFNR